MRLLSQEFYDARAHAWLHFRGTERDARCTKECVLVGGRRQTELEGQGGESPREQNGHLCMQGCAHGAQGCIYACIPYSEDGDIRTTLSMKCGINQHVYEHSQHAMLLAQTCAADLCQGTQRKLQKG